MKYWKYLVILTLAIIAIYCLSDEKETFILCLGDSITDSEWGNYPTHLNKLFIKRNVACTAISRGIPGNTSGEYLEFFSKSKMLKKFKPKVIVIMLGTNDVRIDHDRTSTKKFKKNISEIINIIRTFEKKKKYKIDIYLCTIPPIFTTDLNTFTKESAIRVDEEIVPAIEELSVEHDLELIDLHSVFERNKDLLPGIHPSPGGYYKIGKVIFNRIMRDSREHCVTCDGDICEISSEKAETKPGK